MNLESCDYFHKAFYKYAREIVSAGIKPRNNIRLYNNTKIVISYLVQHGLRCAMPEASSSDEYSFEDEHNLFTSSPGIYPEQETKIKIDSRMETYPEYTLPCSIEHGIKRCHPNPLSQDECVRDSKMLGARTKLGDTQNTTAMGKEDGFPFAAHDETERLPIVKFEDFPWLCDQAANLLLENYVIHYPPDETVENFLHVKHASSAVMEAFSSAYPRVSCPVKRGLVMCKLFLKIRESDFPKSVLRKIMDGSASLFSLKDVLLHENISRRCANKFIKHLAAEQEEELNLALLSDEVHESFILFYLPHLTRKYEFAHLSGFLMHFVSKYSDKVSIKIQKYLISLMADMFFLETYFEQITLFYKKFMTIENKTVQSLNEKILSMVLLCGRAMDKEVFVGNIKNP